MSNSVIKCSQFEQKLKKKQILFSLIDDDYQTFKSSKNHDFSSFQQHIKDYIDFSDNEPHGLNNLGSTLMSNFKFWAMLISMKLKEVNSIKDKRIAFLQLMNTAIMFEVTARNDFKEFFKNKVEDIFTDKILLSLINQHKRPRLENKTTHKVIMDNIHYILMNSDYFEENIGEFEVMKSKKILGAKTEEMKEEDNVKMTDETLMSKKEKEESKVLKTKKPITKGTMRRTKRNSLEVMKESSIIEDKRNNQLNKFGKLRRYPKKKKEEEKKAKKEKKKKKEMDFEELLEDDDNYDVMAPLSESEMERIFKEAENNERRKDSMYSLSSEKYDSIMNVSISDDDIMDDGMSLLMN